jgi:glyoxylase-like metal-dependent hydrolase (beta-lactamase superfamily II)
VLQRDVAPGVHRVEDAFTNAYLVEDGDGVTVVDALMPRSFGKLVAALGELGRAPADVGALVVTHAHADHVGCAERIRREWNVPVWLHERDRSLSRHPLRYEKEHSPLRHRSPYTLRVALALGRAGALMTKGITEVRAFSKEEELDVPGRLRPVFTPGHTHGHTAFHLPDRGVVIAGDALCTRDPYNGGRRGAFILSGAATADSAMAMASLQRIADTGADTVVVGHGEPWTRGAQAAVDEAREHGPS